MFSSSAFVCGVVMAFFTSFAMFGGTFLLPLYFQLAQGADAAASGFLIMPFLSSSVVGAVLGGQLARRIGRTKWIMIAGLLGCVAGFAGLALVDRDSALIWSALCMVMLGTGVGVLFPTIMVTVQNAAEHRDVGIATGTLLLLRSMGGAFGSTIVGAVLAAQFATGLARLGVTAGVDMAALRGRGSVLPGYSSATMQLVHSALQSAFRIDFLLCAGLMLAGLVAGLCVQDVQLRGGAGASGSTPGMGH
jgi:MFS family permease